MQTDFWVSGLIPVSLCIVSDHLFVRLCSLQNQHGKMAVQGNMRVNLFPDLSSYPCSCLVLGLHSEPPGLDLRISCDSDKQKPSSRLRFTSAVAQFRGLQRTSE